MDERWLAPEDYHPGPIFARDLTPRLRRPAWLRRRLGLARWRFPT